MIGWILTKPAIMLDVVLFGIIIAFGFYFWYSQNQLTELHKTLSMQIVQIEQNANIIKDLNAKMLLVQQLNDNFNKTLNSIREQQSQSAKSLTSFDLATQSIHNPKKSETFINTRTNDLFQGLNSFTHNTAGIAK